MGRVKLKIKRLETASARQVTYSKRKAGITKKAMELSILCDIDVALVMFSPTGKPTVCVGANNDLAGVLDRFSRIPMQERSKRKLEVFEVLKKAFKKVDHTVDIQRLMGDGRNKIEELNNQKQALQAQIQEKNHKLSYWTKPEDVQDMAQIRLMEESLVETLNRLQKRKVHLNEKRAYRSWTGTHAPRFAWVPEHLIAQSRISNEHNAAASQRDVAWFGNRSVRTDIGGLGQHFGFQYPHQHEHEQPSYSYSGSGLDHPKAGMDLNLSAPFYNQMARADPHGAYNDPSSLPYSE